MCTSDGIFGLFCCRRSILKHLRRRGLLFDKHYRVFVRGKVDLRPTRTSTNLSLRLPSNKEFAEAEECYALRQTKSKKGWMSLRELKRAI